MLNNTYAKLLADLEREMEEAKRDLKRLFKRIDLQREYIETLRQGVEGLRKELAEDRE